MTSRRQSYCPRTLPWQYTCTLQIPCLFLFGTVHVSTHDLDNQMRVYSKFEGPWEEEQNDHILCLLPRYTQSGRTTTMLFVQPFHSTPAGSRPRNPWTPTSRTALSDVRVNYTLDLAAPALAGMMF